MTENRKPRPKEKKSEMLDVRLPFGLKQALVEACRKQGVTVSDTVRGLISEYVNATKAGQTHPKLRGIAMKIARNPLKTTGMALTSLAAFALTAAPSTADERLFKALDLDGDGTISAHDLNERRRSFGNRHARRISAHHPIWTFYNGWTCQDRGNHSHGKRRSYPSNIWGSR